MTHEGANRRSAVAEARRRLEDYIDALCTGSATASPPSRDAYTQRLAVAAKLLPLLRQLRSVGELRELVRRENAAFPRDLFVTEEGRKARSAFNLFARAAVALEEYCASDGSIAVGPEAIIGEQLSAVTFVMDYIQLDFDGQQFTVLCPLVVCSEQNTVRSGDEGFRDGLCGLIGHTARSISVRDEAVVISFDKRRIELLFASDDSLSQEEPLIFRGEDHYLQVFRLPKANARER